MGQKLEEETFSFKEQTILEKYWKGGIVFLVVILSFAYLGYLAFDSAKVYYYTVSEVKNSKEIQEDRIVRVNGKLVDDSFKRDAGSTIAYFSLTDGVEILDAEHEGIIPELFFNEHSEIVLEGYNRSDSFHTENIIVKCPSKYVAEADNE